LLLRNIFDAVRRKIAISLMHSSIIKVARKLLHAEEPHQPAGLNIVAAEKLTAANGGHA
jgi:hypothetical protein